VTHPDSAPVGALSGSSSGSRPETTNETGGSRTGLPRMSARPKCGPRGVVSDALIGLVLAVLAWSSSTFNLFPSPFLEGWGSALAMAAHNAMPFGTHIVFSYGPLGFLTVQELFYSSTAVLAFVFTIAISTAVFGTLIWSLRRVVPVAVAVLVAYVVGAVSLQLVTDPEYVLALVLVVCVAVLSRADDGPVSLWIWLALGGVFSVFSLVKVSLSVGIAAALIITVACLTRGRGRAIVALATGATTTFCLCWFGTGNGFGNILAFARASAAIISGYSAAMSIEDPTRSDNYWFAALAVILVGAFALAHGRGLPRRSRIGIGLVTLVIVWLLFKEGFVRHDYHDLIFFAASPLVLAAFVPWRRSWVLVPGVLVLTVVTCIVAGGLPPLVTRPDMAVRNFYSEATTLASSGRRAVVIDQARQSLRSASGIPNRMVAMMRGQTVYVSPSYETLVWAYPQLRFDPLPVIADYSAYTPSLDQLDASYLASSDAPHFILRQPYATDGRDPAFEPPATQLAIECRYRQVAGDGGSWQLLERGADRCSQPQPLGTARTGFDHWVAVPTAPAGDAVVARFQLSQGWWAKLETILFKPPEVFLRYKGTNPPWRFVASTASDLHVIRAASTLGYYPAFVPVAPTSLQFSIEGGNGDSAGVKISFYKIREAAVAGGNGEVIPKLLTSVLLPANGARLSGITVLAAEATEGVGVTKVEFLLTDETQHATVIGRFNTFVWLAKWNTTGVTNGTYTLQSVAYDAAGRSSHSTGITITVKNKSDRTHSRLQQPSRERTP
jgi:hypothetical protein